MYGAVFKAYVRALIKTGMCTEVFVEGGRSRTGRLRNCRFGVLSTIVGACEEKEASSDDTVLCPVAITYDTIMEIDSYVRELLGVPKKKESVYRLVRRTLNLPKVGDAHVAFGKPISIGAALGTRDTKKRQAVAALGQQVCLSLGNLVVVTPTAIISTLLLSSFDPASGTSNVNRVAVGIPAPWWSISQVGEVLQAHARIVSPCAPCSHLVRTEARNHVDVPPSRSWRATLRG